MTSSWHEIYCQNDPVLKQPTQGSVVRVLLCASLNGVKKPYYKKNNARVTIDGFVRDLFYIQIGFCIFTSIDRFNTVSNI